MSPAPTRRPKIDIIISKDRLHKENGGALAAKIKQGIPCPILSLVTPGLAEEHFQKKVINRGGAVIMRTLRYMLLQTRGA